MQFARQELRREVERELALSGKPLYSNDPWIVQAVADVMKLANATTSGTDHVTEEVNRRLPDRLRELELHPPKSGDRIAALRELGNDCSINHFTLFQSEDALIKALAIREFDLEN